MASYAGIYLFVRQPHVSLTRQVRQLREILVEIGFVVLEITLEVRKCEPPLTVARPTITASQSSIPTEPGSIVFTGAVLESRLSSLATRVVSARRQPKYFALRAAVSFLRLLEVDDVTLERHFQSSRPGTRAVELRDEIHLSHFIDGRVDRPNDAFSVAHVREHERK